MGWQQNVLRIDLSSGKISTEPLNMEWAREYLGGRGLGSKYLTEMLDPSVDAMSPENVLIFVTGPLTGTMASTGGRYAVVTKGPLTGAIACSNAGGKFGAELKLAGYDMVIISGRSESPVYLHIVDDEVAIRPADEIQGTSVWHTEEWLKTRHQDSTLKVAAIGVAGEKGVRFACIVNDLHRAAGRSGVGAVMGSKNLKAIATKGTKGVKVHDPKQFMTAVTDAKAKLAANVAAFTALGTHAMIDSMQAFGGLPTRNFREVQFEGVEKINPDAARERRPNGFQHHITNKACFACTIACGRIAHIDKDHFTVVNRPEYWGASGGLEFETAFALGPVVGVDDIDALTFASFLTNEHGMDPISFGVTLAAAMELYEIGALTKQDTGGIALNFGSAEALTTMAELTGKQEGFGVELGLGSKRLCEKYGHPELAMQVKGQEFAGYDARALQGMGLGYATSNRGACHLKHNMFAQDMEDQTGAGKAAPCKESQDRNAIMDSSGVCLFTTGRWGFESLQAQIDAACEGEWSVEYLMTLGERVWNLERQFNLKAGLSAADDTLPKRLLESPAPSGTAEGKVNELSKMLPEYYEVRGWTSDGVPTPETLARLGLQ